MLSLSELNKSSFVAVHFILSSDLGADLFSKHELKVIETSIGEVTSDKELFSVISTAMKFPDYFGNNWDALDECLADLDWLPAHGYILILRDAAKAWAINPHVLGRFVTTWLGAVKHWSENKKPFHLVFIM
ncbi:MAG: barstar family protein [Gammaproteobacteria bacterium]|nr:barstar family protein [Gammaproteobacteria bacterium]